MTRIVYKTPDFIIAYKPSGIPSQSDRSGDPAILTELSKALLELGEHSELYLIHRLDRVVGGILVFARNKKSAAILSSLVQDGELCKEYYAVVDGIAPGGDMVDYLLGHSAYKDTYMCLADFNSFIEAHYRMDKAYADQEEWNRKSLLSIASMGYFSSDRSIEEYSSKIWNLKKNED